mmetsp:Transcript_44132/g.49455  ORF Transcript_44132/g.49455 Transcript_44132/m.49455 type:complete len:80 (-) Transcript_44132:35-274(-)
MVTQLTGNVTVSIQSNVSSNICVDASFPKKSIEPKQSLSVVTHTTHFRNENKSEIDQRYQNNHSFIHCLLFILHISISN